MEIRMCLCMVSARWMRYSDNTVYNALFAQIDYNQTQNK